MTINPWDVREYSKLELDPNPLYTSVGRALSEWEGMEGYLAHFFQFFCGGTDYGLPANRAYGAVISFSGRSGMLKAAAEAYFHQWVEQEHSMKSRFYELLKDANNFSPRRNEIAHGRVTIGFFDPESQGKGIAAALAGARWLLLPNAYSTTKNTLVPLDPELIRRTKPKYAYSTVEIDYYGQQFTAMRQRIWQLVMDWSDAYPDADILPPI